MDLIKKLDDYFLMVEESLDKPMDIGWKKVGSDVFGIFDVNSTIYKIEFIKQVGNNFSFSFCWKNGQEWDYKMTNLEKGKFYVLSTIVSALNHLFREYNPDSILFSAIDTSNTRKRLYKIYCQDFCKEINYKLIDRGNERMIMYIIFDDKISDNKKEDIFLSAQKIVEQGK